MEIIDIEQDTAGDLGDMPLVEMVDQVQPIASRKTILKKTN